MDYTLKPNGYNILMTFDKNSSVVTEIAATLATTQGTFFQRPDFGIPTITKLTTDRINLFQQQVLNALQYLIAIGRASTIDVLCEKDITVVGRLNIKVTATEPSGLIVTYETFQRVV